MDIAKYLKAKIITDASPEGLRAVPLINSKVTKAFTSVVTVQDAQDFGFDHNESSSQGVVETMAVVVAIGVENVAACHIPGVQTICQDPNVSCRCKAIGPRRCPYHQARRTRAGLLSAGG